MCMDDISFLFINKAFSFLDKLKLDAFILTPVKLFFIVWGAGSTISGIFSVFSCSSLPSLFI